MLREKLETIIEQWVHDCPPTDDCYKCQVLAALSASAPGVRGRLSALADSWEQGTHFGESAAELTKLGRVHAHQLRETLAGGESK